MLKFSVICPFYNSDKYLKFSIESVINQTYSFWELILINDGSTDSSESICKNYLKDNRIKLISLPHQGPQLARLKGIDQATGSYLLFLDSDDLFGASLMESLLSKITKDNADILFYQAFRFQDNQKPFLYRSKIQYDDTIVGADVILYRCYIENQIYCLWERCFKKSLFANILVPKELARFRFAEDALLSFLVTLNASKMTFINKPLYYYRINPSGTTYNLNTNDSYGLYLIYHYIYSNIINRGKLPKNTIFYPVTNAFYDYIYKLDKKQLLFELKSLYYSHPLSPFLHKIKGTGFEKIVLHLYKLKFLHLISVLIPIHKKMTQLLKRRKIKKN